MIHKKAQVPLVDTRCFELAEVFLADVDAKQKRPEDAMALAAEIQMTIEDYLREVETRDAAPQ